MNQVLALLANPVVLSLGSFGVLWAASNGPAIAAAFRKFTAKAPSTAPTGDGEASAVRSGVELLRIKASKIRGIVDLAGADSRSKLLDLCDEVDAAVDRLWPTESAP